MIVRYVNSQNKSFDFIDANVLPVSGYFHQRKLNASIDNDATIEITDCTYTITLNLRGSLDDRKKKLDEICDIIEVDCNANIPGTLYFGNYYIKCYIISSNTSIATINTRTSLELGIFCPKQEWIRQKQYILPAYASSKSSKKDIKKYKYSYPYIYSTNKGTISIVNESLSDSDFILRFYGECSNPYIKVGNILYQVNTTLADGEYLEIDSSNNTITGFDKYGNKRNLFYYRDMQSRSDFFVKIPSGLSEASWSGSFNAELIVFDKRGEPRWIQ